MEGMPKINEDYYNFYSSSKNAPWLKFLTDGKVYTFASVNHVHSRGSSLQWTAKIGSVTVTKFVL
jgi:hypothetical protein